MSARTLVGVIALAAALTGPSVGLAQATADDEARGLFTAGQAAFERGEFEAALEHWERAHSLSGRPELLYNIGQAADRLRDDTRALNAFEAYLAAVPQSPHRASVERRIAVLREAASRRAVVRPNPYLAPVDPAASAEPVTAPAHVARAAQPAEPETRPVVASDTDPPQERSSIATKWWFWTIVGVVVVGGVTATVLATRPGSPDYTDSVLGGTVFTLGSQR